MKPWSMLLAMMMFLAILTSSSTAWTQPTNDGGTSGCENAIEEADTLIESARANARAQEQAKKRAEARRDEVILEKEGVESERDKCRGDVARLEFQLFEKEQRLESNRKTTMPWWIALGLHTFELGGATVGGVCLLNDCAPTTTIVAILVAVGAAVLDGTDLFWTFD